MVAGDAQATLTNLPSAFDLAFIRAEKDNDPAHLLVVENKLPPGGPVLANSVVSHDISGFQTLVGRRDDPVAVTLPLERGSEWVVKVG